MREKLSENFYRDEFKCLCGECDFDVVDAKLLEVLEGARDYFDKPININSACRCEDWNAKVGGSDKSQHKLGKAADIVCRDITPLRFYQYFDAKYPDTFGLGLYEKEGFVHIDVRLRKARWGL